MNIRVCLVLIGLVVVSKGFSQYGHINADSIRNSLKPGDSRFVIETFVGDSVISRQTISKSHDSNGAEEQYIVRFSADPLMGNTLKGTANTRILESEHAQFKRDFSQLLSKNGTNQLKSASSLVRREFKTLINGVAITMPASLAAEVKKLGYVTKVEKDELIRLNDESSNETIEVPKVWNELGYTGKGVVIAIVDTGVDTSHVCFSGNKFVNGYDFANNDDDPFDDHFHGTHCAGIAAANSDKIKGVAPDARIMPVKVLNKDGYGRNSDIIAGIEFAIDPDHDPNTNDGAEVVSLSLGGQGYPDDAMSVAIDNAVLHGAVCVVAAGNAGFNNYTIQSPGCARKAITVGSCSNSGVTSYFSSRGPSQITQAVKPEVSAPGEAIYSSIPGSKYENYSGTSMATPHVAGLAALIKQKNPTWEPEIIKSVIIQSAQKKSGKVLEEGFGMVNAYKALQNNLIIAPFVCDLGVIDYSQGTRIISKEIQVSNTSAMVKEITFSPGKPVNGISISLPVNSLHLASGETKTLSFSCVIDPNALGNFDLIPMISSEILVNEGENSYCLPIVCFIGKTVRISFERTPDYCAVFNSDWGSSVNIPVNESELELIFGKNKTDLLASFDDFNRYVLKENIEQSKELIVDSKDAKNEIRFNVQSPGGVPLNLCDGNNEEFRKKGKKYSGFRLMRFHFFISDKDELPGVKKYFSNISSDYAYENSLLAFPTFNKDIKQIINVPVGLNQGLNESREIVVNSSDYKKLKFNLDLGEIHKNISYTTDNRNSGLLNSDPYLKSLHLINPRSVFEFYMLPLPYDEFLIADGIRFTFWNKIPESYPYDQPIFTTGFFSLNKEGEFTINPFDNSDRIKIGNSPISLNKNFKSPNILFMAKELLYPSLVLYGKYNEAYTDSLYIKTLTGSEVKSIDTLINGISYDFFKETKLKNLSPNDSVVFSTSYAFNELIRTKAEFSFKKGQSDNTYFDFPKQVSLNGNAVQNRYLLPGEKNFISLFSMYKPKIWLRPHGSADWIQIGLDMTNYVFGPNHCTESLNRFGKGYYDLKVISVDNSGTPSISRWIPGFYVGDETQADSLYLVELYKNTEGEKWVNHSGWLTERLSDWHGITLTNGRVSEIRLANNNLIGSIPKEFTKLTNLISLDISGNHIDFIPDLSKLHHLTALYAKENKLDFSSIVPNKTIPLFDFSSQDSLIIGCNRDIVEGDLQAFSINNEFEGNHYQWFKDNELVNENDSSNFTFVCSQTDDAGIYYGQVSNKAIPDFFIPTQKVQVKVRQKIFEPVKEIVVETNTPGIVSTNWVDIDNDGDEDLFIGNKNYNKSKLFINKMAETGQAIFEEAGREGLWNDSLSVSASSFGDYNNDGLEDLAIFSDQGSIGLQLFENMGDLNFTKKQISVSLNNAPLEFLQGSSWVDLNHDNYLDLVFGYYEGARFEGGLSNGLQLLNNKGSINSNLINCKSYSGTMLFSDILKEKGTELIRSFGEFEILKENIDCGMDPGSSKRLFELYQNDILKPNTPTLGDFDNDSDLDIFCPIHNPLFSSTDNSNVFLENTSNTFQGRTDLSPVIKEIESTSGSVCFDFDNDGDLDLAVSNARWKNELYKNLFMETGKLAFETVTDDVFENEPGNWIGISASDINLDGYLDLTKVSASSVQFLMNKMKENNWLSVKCNATVSNGSAVGAKVYAITTINGKKTTQYREILAASGETSVTSRRLHFGLGNASKIDSLIIKWPSGITNVFKDVEINQYMDATESLDQIPIANAGDDLAVKLGESVTLDGSASFDLNGELLSFKWTAPNNVQLSAPNAVNPSFIAPVSTYDRSYMFTLVVTNGINDSPADQVLITVKGNKNPPVANAGADQIVNEGEIVTLDGTASFDADLDMFTYSWVTPVGIILNTGNVVKPSFIAPEVKNDSVITIALTVNDNQCSSNIAVIKVTILNVIKVGNSTFDSPFFKIYPNPSVGYVYVENLNNRGGILTVSLSDMMGKEVFRKEITAEAKNKLDLSSLVNGIYFLTLTNNDLQNISKIMIRK